VDEFSNHFILLTSVYLLLFAASWGGFGHLDGWRVAFVGAATAAAAVGFLNFAIAEDPRFIYNRRYISKTPKSFAKALQSLTNEMSVLLHVPSFTLTVVQGKNNFILV
jgi:hypothetical protein